MFRSAGDVTAVASPSHAPSGIIDPESVPDPPGSLISCLRSFIIAFVHHASSDHFLIQGQARTPESYLVLTRPDL